MNAAQADNKVQVHYTGKLADGEVFDSSRGEGREPLEFVLGAGAVIAGFDAAVTGMVVGEDKTVTIPVDEAYGPRRDDLVLKAERSDMPEGFEPAIGEVLMMQGEGSGQMPVTIVEMDESSVTLDANHRLAGQSLVFELSLVAILQV